MTRKAISLAAVSALLLVTLILLVRFDHQRSHMLALFGRASAGDPVALKELTERHTLYANHLVQQLAVDSSSAPATRAAAFDYIAQDRHRQISLCRYIGEENGELDELAENRFFGALQAESNIAPECLHAALQRLIDLPSAVRPTGQLAFYQTSSGAGPQQFESGPSSVDQLRGRVVNLLRQHGSATAEILRKRYGIGSANPEPGALPAVEALQLKQSCPDLRRTEQAIEASGGLYAEDYQNAAASLCR